MPTTPDPAQFSTNDLGIWVPRDVDSTSREFEGMFRHPELSFSLVSFDSRFISDAEPSVELICDRLNQYSLETIVHTISRINLLLDEPNSLETMIETQAKLGKKILGTAKAAEIVECALRDAPEIDWNQRGCFFNERQTLNTLKLACLLDLPDSTERGDLMALGEALLIMNDLMDHGITAREGESPEDVSARLELYMFANSLFFQGRSILPELSRAWTLFLNPDRYEESEFDIADRLSRAVGQTPMFFLWSLRMIHAYYYTLDEVTIDEGRISIGKRSAFSKSFDIEERRSSELVESISWASSDLVDRIRCDYRIDDLRYYDILPFAEKPLVSFSSNSYCVSRRLLQFSSGMNLQYRFLDPGSFSEVERQQFLNFKGYVFEDYVFEMLERMFGGTRVVKGEEFAEEEGKVCDFVIDYGHTLIMLETKATLVPIAAQFALSMEAYLDRVINILRQSVLQMSDTAGRIAEGQYINEGFDGDRVEDYYYVTVTLELMGSPMTTRRIRREMADDEALPEEQLSRFTVIDVTELERLETAVANGDSMLELIRDKLQDEATRDMPMKNYLSMLNKEWIDEHNPYLKETFGDLHEALDEITASVSKDGDEPTRRELGN